MVDRLGETKLVDAGLKTALQEVLNLQGQHVIETHAGLIEHTDADETANKGVTLEKTFGVLVIELEEFTSSTTNLGKDETDTPDLTLVAQAVLAGELFGLGCLNSDHMFLDEETEHTFNSASRRADSKGRRGTL